jgi:hypothetical protein
MFPGLLHDFTFVYMITLRMFFVAVLGFRYNQDSSFYLMNLM